MSRKRKAGLAALVLVLLTTLTACTGKSGGAGDGQDTITVWTYPVYDGYEAELKQSIEEYKKEHPKVTIQYELLSWEEGGKKLDVALNSGNPPDIYFSPVSGQYVASGLALPLDSYMTQEIRDDFYPGILELGQIKGKQYGLPLYVEVHSFGGNRRILEEAGIDWRSIQRSGWTWTEFLAAAKKLTKPLPDGRIQYGFVTDGTSNDFLELLTRNAGLPDAVDATGKFVWNDERILKTLRFVRSLLDEGVMPKETVSLNPQKRTELFYNSQAAMLSKAFVYYDVTLKKRNADIDAGKLKGEKIDFVLLPVPHEDRSPAKTTTAADGYVAFKQKNDKGEAHAKRTFEVLEYLTGPRAGKSANELAASFARRSQAAAFEGKSLGKPENLEAAETMRKQLAEKVEQLLAPEQAAKLKQFKDQVQKPVFQAVLNGEKTPEQAAEEFKTKGRQLFGGE
ncbi:hypothetical protein J31TS4_04280 [Paenibacillus sp. J31TS4]|uniref:ABC transporter substrate-binding protein n=1 Tax=Paenibacillus sp. J31TS4 TaxID=2807195 RepID=UPI001B2D099F|nr:sugar ABC transporter substrate-binding protein [Paenibacillus sp. J31TS4]GIP37148.1 hypothetical protein J31TS4_04280 [Paenibacillus sp. J31TS4]